MEGIILQNINEWGWLIYFAIAFIMLFEGEMILFLTTYLAQKGYFNIYILLPVAFCAAVIGDCLWFEFGSRLAKNKWIGHRLSKVASPIDKFLAKHPRRTIFISKFTYGLNRATLVRVRASGVTFRKFIQIELFTIVVWMSVICSLAFASFAAFEQMKRNIKLAEFGLLLAIVCFFLVSKIISKIGRKQIEADEV